MRKDSKILLCALLQALILSSCALEKGSDAAVPDIEALSVPLQTGTREYPIQQEETSGSIWSRELYIPDLLWLSDQEINEFTFLLKTGISGIGKITSRWYFTMWMTHLRNWKNFRRNHMIHFM